MIYMLKVDLLVAAVVFGLAGVFILALFVWTETMKYAEALRGMQRVRATARREPFVISRPRSRNQSSDFFRVA